MAADARSAALTALERCRRSGAWSPAAIDSAIRAAGLDGRDAALCTRLCLAVLQNETLCDFYIDCWSTTRAVKLEPKIRDILRLSICQLLFMERMPAHAAVSEGVALTRRYSPRAAGLVNAVLRRVAENRGNLPPVPGEGTAEHLSVRYSHPLWLCRRLVDEMGYDGAAAFLAANNSVPPVCVQTNTLRTTPEELADTLRGEGLSPRETAVPGAFDIGSPGDIRRLESFRRGLFYVQDCAARMSVRQAGLRPGMSVLDACAAPGGKSFAAALDMQGKGGITACDINAKKLPRIADGAARLGMSMIETRCMDAREPDEAFFGRFDAVLADVPCSGLGVIRRKPEIRKKTAEECSALPEIQRAMIGSLSRCVRPGGVLVYSTCTVLRAENEDVVADFLAENGGFEVLVPPRTFLPHIDGTDGFFTCVLRKRT